MGDSMDSTENNGEVRQKQNFWESDTLSLKTGIRRPFSLLLIDKQWVGRIVRNQDNSALGSFHHT